MVENPKIQTVCGFGCGSSLMLKMNVEAILKQHSLHAEVFCGDVGTCCSNLCDVIFISRELEDNIRSRAAVPLVVFDNFMNKTEVETKTLAYFDSLPK